MLVYHHLTNGHSFLSLACVGVYVNRCHVFEPVVILHIYASTIVMRFFWDTFPKNWTGFVCKFIGGNLYFLVYFMLFLLWENLFCCRILWDCLTNQTIFSSSFEVFQIFAEKAISSAIFLVIKSQRLRAFLIFIFPIFLIIPYSCPHLQAMSHFFLTKFNHLSFFIFLEAPFIWASSTMIILPHQSSQYNWLIYEV